MARSSKVARLPAYWFHWYPHARSTEFYVDVYWEVKRLRLRKSNKAKVLEVMIAVDNCDTYRTNRRLP